MSLVLECMINEGKTDAVRTALQSLAADVRKNEPGVVDYRTFIDGDKILFVDTYADSGAFMNHMGRESVQESLNTVLGMMELTTVHVLGDVSDDVRAAMADFNPRFAEPFTGFVRLRTATAEA